MSLESLSQVPSESALDYAWLVEQKRFLVASVVTGWASVWILLEKAQAVMRHDLVTKVEKKICIGYEGHEA